MVPTGGGGLIAGIAAAVHFLAPQVRVIGVQAASAAAWPGSLAAGQPVRAESMSTMADGIAVALPGAVPFAHVRAFADSVRTVSEDALSRALLLCRGFRGGPIPRPQSTWATSTTMLAFHAQPSGTSG